MSQEEPSCEGPRQLPGSHTRQRLTLGTPLPAVPLASLPDYIIGGPEYPPETLNQRKNAKIGSNVATKVPHIGDYQYARG